MNTTGIKQAESLREMIRDLNIDIIISSPLLRARHTANIININNKKIIYDNRIKERDCGSLSGKSITVTNREEYWNYYTNIQYGTAEEIKTFFARVFTFLDELKNKSL